MELKDRSFLIVDLETTGFDEKKHQILEIGMLAIKNMDIIASMNIAVKHKEYTLTTSTMQSNKINLIEHEKNALTLDEAGTTMLKFFQEYNESEKGFIPIGQNVEFDLRFLEAMFLKIGRIKEYREYVSYRKLDIMQLALIKNLEGKINLEKQDLDYLLNSLSIDIPNYRHKALGDCQLEYEVLKRLLTL